MNRLVIGIASLTACIPLLIAATVPTISTNAMKATTSAIGEGSMSFHGGNGVGWFKFNIQAGEPASGTLIFAAEHHHDAQTTAMMFPDIIIRLSDFSKTTFKDNIVRFSGSGTWHEDPVKVSVEVYDNEGSKKEDRLVIRATSEDGELSLFADGFLFRGNIRVGGE